MTICSPVSCTPTCRDLPGCTWGTRPSQQRMQVHCKHCETEWLKLMTERNACPDCGLPVTNGAMR